MSARMAVMFLVCSLSSGVLSAETWHVNIAGTGDAPTIQAAIDSAAIGDTVLVGPGRYTWSNQGSGDERGFIRVMERKRIILWSGGGAELTILDAEYMSRTVYVQGMNHIVVEGFTITGGEAPDFGDNVGGGYFNHISGDTIRYCRFTGNRALYGGGISSCGNGYVTLIEHCEFVGNEAYRIGGAAAFCCSSASSIVRDCLFIDNTAGDEGGAVALHLCPLTTERCIFSGNSAGDRGGAVAAFREGHAIIASCTFDANSAPAGAAISVVGISSLDIRRTIVYRNWGSWLRLELELSAIAGCNCIFGNSGGDFLPPGVTDAGNNIFLDPLFCGPSGPDQYYLHENSPCLPINHPGGIICQLIGARPAGCDEVSTERKSWSGIKSF